MKYLCFSLFILATSASALDNGQALLPPMGWLSWERFRCNTDCKKSPKECISENLIRDMADRLVDGGFADAGYTVVGIDDCWLAKERSSDGELQPDPERFPSGIKALADYVHKRGLQLGIYGDIGSKTCGGYPGMAGHLEQDALTFAEWGIDYLKVDGCFADVKEYEEDYSLLSQYLNDTGRQITYSCSWPAYLPDPVQTGFEVPYKALRAKCNLWRNWEDIQDSWDSLASILVFWAKETLHNKHFQGVAGPGAWNDPDMLIIGNEGLKAEHENQVQMGMWAILAAPLMMSNDLRALPKAAKDLLLNEHLIQVNQDPLGFQGSLIACADAACQRQLWFRRLQQDRRALAFLNLSDENWAGDNPCIRWSDIQWEQDARAKVKSVIPELRHWQEVTEEFCLDQPLLGRSMVLLLAEPFRRTEWPSVIDS